MRKYTAILAFFLLLAFAVPLSAASWEDVDTWEATLTSGSWWDVDTWNGTLNVEASIPVYGWEDVDTWTTTLDAPSYERIWQDVDTWGNTLSMLAINTDVFAYDFSVIAATPTNGYISMSGYDAVYATAQTTYDSRYSIDSGTFYVGQDYLSGTAKYMIKRSYILLDLTGETSTITSAALAATAFDDDSTTDFYVQMREYTEATFTTDSTGFNAYGATSFGEWNSENYNTNMYGVVIPFNEDGLDFLNDHLGEEVMIVLVSDREMAGTTPSNLESIKFYTQKAAYDDEQKPTLFYSTSVLPTEWESVVTWTTTLNVGEDIPYVPGEPSIPYSRIIDLILPIAFLFTPAVAFATKFGSIGFILGLGLGLILLWFTGSISLGIMLLGCMAIAAIYWKVD